MTVPPSNTFCILPWIHIYANPDGSVLPCCIADHHSHMGNTQTQTLHEIWNGEEFKEMRRNMLSGRKCKQCTACYKMEETGVGSFRQSVNKKYSHYIPLVDNTYGDGSLDEVTLRYFDVRWSNICNFKCRSCSPTYSSSWAKEEGRENIFIFAGGNNNDYLFEQFKPYFKDIEEFYFAGGEPLLTDKHYDILNHLIDIGKTDVEIRYNTNLSILKYKQQSIIDLWKHFPTINIGASIDSWGERAEYIREGTDWNVIESNIKRIQDETPHVNIQMHSVVSLFNIATLDSFLETMLSKSLFFKENFYPTFYNLQNPSYYSVNVLPDNLKGKIRAKLEKISISSEIDSSISEIINFLDDSEYDPLLHKEFLKQTNYYDSIRNKDFVQTFPELSELYETLF
jgi:radical SAM protein with 4Fe4S-binding SPASM domain